MHKAACAGGDDKIWFASGHMIKRGLTIDSLNKISMRLVNAIRKDISNEKW